MTPAIDITTAQRKTLLTLLRRFIPGVLVWAYGSRVKWTARPNSDLDLVAFTTPAQSPRVSELKEALAESNLPYPVDLHVWDEIPERFHAIIRNEFVVLQEAEEKPLRREMPDKWEEAKLGAEVDFLTGFPFKSDRYTDSDESVRLLRGDNIVQGSLRWEGVKKWPASEIGKHKDYQLRDGDVVLAMDRPWIEAGLKYAAISKYDLPCLLVQRTARLRGGHNLDTGFLRYLIGSREFTQHILAVQTGTAVPHISGTQIKDFTFLKPPLTEQRAIASVLGALDDKIELNRRMNETLEALAQSLFKSWFVDATQSALPKVWREGKVSDLATLSRDGLNPGEFPDETFDHYSLPAFDEGRTPRPERGDTIMSNKFIVPPDCVMVSKLNPRIPRIWLPDLRGQNRAVCSTEFLVATPKTGVSREFLYCLFINESFVSVFTTMVTGTSGSHQRVRPESLLNMDTPLPPAPLIQKFTDTVAPMLKRISQNIHESRTLAALRDALLPKLLSGELRVPANLVSLEL